MKKKAWTILAIEKEGKGRLGKFLLMKNNKKTLGKFLLMKKKEKERFENFCY
jgi:hypothetical protein